MTWALLIVAASALLAYVPIILIVVHRPQKTPQKVSERHRELHSQLDAIRIEYLNEDLSVEELETEVDLAFKRFGPK